MKQAHYDLVVCGGGIPGTCAAISAARSGVKVALTEMRPILGGNSSSLAMVPPHGAAAFWHNRCAREGGILEELLQEFARRSPVADNRRIWDSILKEWCDREPDLDLFLNARVNGVETSNRRIEAVQVSQSSTERAYRFSAPVFVDATGDGYVAFTAGADVRMGREGRAEFGERRAPETGDSKDLPASLYLIAHKRDRPIPFTPPPWAVKLDSCNHFPHRRHDVDRFSTGKLIADDGSAIRMFWWCALGGERDIIKDSEEIQAELEAHALGIWDHMKNHCTPETRKATECYEAVWWSLFPLRRSSRRFDGDYVLTEGDVFEPKLFEDRVSYGGWPLDVHPPEGLHSTGPPCDQSFVNELFSIPFRTMYSRNIDNLMLAGRCLSSSHAAMGAIRVMNTLGAAAEAVGIAAALCNEHGVDPREVRQSHMQELQQRILKADGYIIGLENRDPADLARTAVVSTSSELRFQAENVDGFVELAYDLAQQLPLSKGRVDKIWILLKSERTEPCPIRVSVLESNKLGRFQREELIVDAEISIAPRGEQWVEVEVNRNVHEEVLLWICVEKQPGVFWAFSNQEAVASRFAVRFTGDLSPKPSYGKARLAPMNEAIAPVRWDWIPINHHGRLPEELHDWIDQSIGVQYGRKVRATLCCRVTPDSMAYGGANVINGISRTENWPNLWISDPLKGFPQDLTLSWDSARTISEIRLTFDTDLCAPDRVCGFPREQFRFVFPVPECVRDYRILARMSHKSSTALQYTGTGADFVGFGTLQGVDPASPPHRLETRTSTRSPLARDEFRETCGLR